MARTLVTGAGGFVGPHLRVALEAAGHEVWTTDRTPSAAAPRHRPAELTDAGVTRAVLEEARPDAVVHLASQSSVAASFHDPSATLVGNLTVACNLLEAVRHVAPRARVLVVGSAEEYGNVPEAEQPIRESQPLRPASPYAVSKCAQEFLALQYAMTWGLDVIATRSFNHSGPGQSDRFVLSSFARQIAAAERGAQEAVLRVGNLDVRRDFLDVRDVVRAYVALLERGECGAVYNVCRGEAPAVRDLLDTLRAAARVETRVETDPERWRPSDLPVLRGDPSRLMERTGWSARLPLDATLRDLLADWRARLAVEPAR
jgi:GDP-4-dehydro-6-deoxy-D-mannose reductase